MVDYASPNIAAESNGDPTAVNPNSTAGGLGQFIDSTWLNTIKSHRPDLYAQHSPQELIAMKTDRQFADLSREMTGAYASDNAAMLKQNGVDPTPGRVYLAHFAGPQGALNLMKADDSAPVRSILGDKVVQANPFLANMTVGNLRAWADRKTGAPVAPVAPVAPGAAAPSWDTFSPSAPSPAAAPATSLLASYAQQQQPTQQQAPVLPGAVPAAPAGAQQQQQLTPATIPMPDWSARRARALAILHAITNPQNTQGAA